MEEIRNILEVVEESATNIDDIVNKLVNTYCSELDEFMGLVKALFDDDSSKPSDDELEIIIMKLPTLLYFVSESIETLSIREEATKLIKLEKYSKAHNECNGKISEKNIFAELNTSEYTLAQLCYQKAARKIKAKLDAAYEQINSVKKILSKRLLDIQLTNNSERGKYYE